MGPTTLYRHFPDKDDLIEAVLDDLIQAVQDNAVSAAQIEDSYECSMVSCNRSSASARLPVIRTAPPRSASSSGTASRTNRAANSALVSTDSVAAV
ncbi:MAG: hypothetical protein JWR48_14 [Mycobacterium sp.]|nr:hypothetical protein [Mycobacterium sp.]